MRKEATKVTEIRRGNLGWRSLTWLLLVAFALQSFVTQTHIHGSPQAMASTTIAKVPESAFRHSPIENDTTNCPFCQAFVHAGAFFASAAPLLLLPVIWTECATQCLIAAAARAPSAHGWQSRAPPQH